MMKMVKQTLPQAQSLQQVQLMGGQNQQSLLGKLGQIAKQGESFEDKETQVICVDVQGDFMVGGSLQLTGGTAEDGNGNPTQGKLPKQDYDEYLKNVNNFLEQQREKHKQAKIVFTQDYHSQTRNHISFNSSHVQKGKESIDVGVPVDVETHYEGYSRKYKQEMWPDHCVEGTLGQEIMQDIEDGDYVQRKGQDDDLEAYSQFKRVFGKKNIEHMLTEKVVSANYEKQYGTKAAGLFTTQKGVADQSEETDGLHKHLSDGENKIKNVILFGLQSDVCVLETQRDARQLGYNVYFINSLSRQVAQQIRDDLQDKKGMQRDAGMDEIQAYFKEEEEYEKIDVKYIADQKDFVQQCGIGQGKSKHAEKKKLVDQAKKLKLVDQAQKNQQNGHKCEKKLVDQVQKLVDQAQKNQQNGHLYEVVFACVVAFLLSLNIVIFFVLKKQMKSQLKKQLGNSELRSVRESHDSEDSQNDSQDGSAKSESEEEDASDDQQEQNRQNPRFNNNDRVFSPQRSSAFLNEDSV